jgi:hypothetical protein
VKTANQIESRTQPELVPNQASKSTIIRGAQWRVPPGDTFPSCEKLS